jgi:hypothetical protein
MRTWMFAPTTFLDSWTGDGLIAMIAGEEIQAAIDRLRRPYVCVSSLLPELGPVSVLPDDEAVGEMVAKHFIDRGFRNFAFCANSDTAPDLPAFITGRQRGFARAIEAAGFEIKGSLVWVKNNHGTGDLKGSFAPKHERIIHAVKGSPELRVRVPDVLTAKDKLNSDHPTATPLDRMRQWRGWPARSCSRLPR